MYAKILIATTATLLTLPLLATNTQPPADFLTQRQNAITAARAITPTNYPNADQVLVENHVYEIYHPNGTSTTWDDDYSLILTEKGRRAASSLSMHFNANYGTATILKAEIIKPDGRTISIDPTTESRIMTEPGQMNANIYDPNNKVLGMNLPGIEIGDICHTLTQRQTIKARMTDTWADYTIFEYSMPIISIDYHISAPDALPIRHHLLRGEIPGTVNYTTTPLPEEQRTLHTWQVRNIPQAFPEPNMPPLHTQVQRLILSTIQDWRTVSRWYWDLCQPALNDITPEIKAKVRELIANSTSRDDTIRRIFKFVSQDIRYMGITPEDTAPGYEPHPVSMTFNNRYGVCRDKAALLAAMLTEAGIPGYPVLIHAGAKMDPDIPIPYFNHAITAVDNPAGGYTLMDPTDEHTRDIFPAYLCNRSYLVARPEGETLLVSPVEPATNNLARITTQGTIDTQGTLSLTTHIALDGINDTIYRGYLLGQQAEQRRTFFEGLLKNRLPGAELLTFDLQPADLQDTDSPLTLTLHARVRDYPVRGSELDIINMPWLGTAIGAVNFVVRQTGLDKRRFTLDSGITCGVTEHITINTSSSMGSLHSLPDPTTIDTSDLLFKLTQSATAHEVTGELNYLLHTPEFDPAAYLKLKQALNTIEASYRQRPIFTARSSHSPDHEILNNSTEVTLNSPNSWTTTHTWSKRILTYAGKKNSSELKINFNPAWQQPALISATVSNANGTIHNVTDKEINIMDAPWVASAPRYPASKTMVVNLPGVETGSVINVITRMQQRNTPFYSRSYIFAATEPVLTNNFAITLPSNLTLTSDLLHPHNITTLTTSNPDSTTTYTWNTLTQPTIRNEEQMPPWHLYQPTLFLSLGTWHNYAKELNLAIRKVSAFDRATRAHTKELIKNIRNPHERLLAIRDEVLRTIRPTQVSFADLPLNTLSTPDRTLADHYGHAADRAILMAAMLKAAGFKAEVKFAANDTNSYFPYTQPYLNNPQRQYFAFPLVELRHKGQTWYLNEGDQYSELGTSLLNGAPLLAQDGPITTIELPEKYRNHHRNEFLVDLDSNGTATISVTNWFFGTELGRYRKQYSELLPEERRRHHLELISAIAKSATPTTDLITNTETLPGYRTYTATAPDYAVISGDTLTLQLPGMENTLLPLRSDSRTNPLFVTLRDGSDLSVRVLLPHGYTHVPLLPPSHSWQLAGNIGTVEINVTTGQTPDNRTYVQLDRQVKRQTGLLQPQLYPTLLEYNRLMLHPASRTLIATPPPN